MQKYKIKQILTTSIPLSAIFERKGCNSRWEEGFPVVGMALVEHDNGSDEIKLLMSDSKGFISYVEQELKDFKEIRMLRDGKIDYSIIDELF